MSRREYAPTRRLGNERLGAPIAARKHQPFKSTTAQWGASCSIQLSWIGVPSVSGSVDFVGRKVREMSLWNGVGSVR